MNLWNAIQYFDILIKYKYLFSNLSTSSLSFYCLENFMFCVFGKDFFEFARLLEITTRVKRRVARFMIEHYADNKEFLPSTALFCGYTEFT